MAHDPATCTRPTKQSLILDLLTLNIFNQNHRRHEHRSIPQETDRLDGFPVVIEYCEDDAEASKAGNN
jgi:hypothetical protein